MTAAAAAGHRPADEDPDERISLMVRLLVTARRADTREVALALGMSRASYYNRVNGDKPWHAKDVARLAAYFGVPVQDLYEGHFRLQPDPQTPITAPDSAAVDAESYRHHYGRNRLALVPNPQVDGVAGTVPHQGQTATPAVRNVRTRISDQLPTVA